MSIPLNFSVGSELTINGGSAVVSSISINHTRSNDRRGTITLEFFGDIFTPLPPPTADTPSQAPHMVLIPKGRKLHRAAS